MSNTFRYTVFQISVNVSLIFRFVFCNIRKLRLVMEKIMVIGYGQNIHHVPGGKYLMKIMFGIEIEISIFEMSNLPNFNKF